jgi:hypothetical protein
MALEDIGIGAYLGTHLQVMEDLVILTTTTP